MDTDWQGTRWRHRKTHGQYIVLRLVTIQDSARTERDNQTAVVYASIDGGEAYVRDLREFMDGRFARIDTMQEVTDLRAKIVALQDVIAAGLRVNVSVEELTGVAPFAYGPDRVDKIAAAEKIARAALKDD